MRLPHSVLVCLLSLPGCANGVQLTADLKTDLRPGIEFASVETRVVTETGAEVAHNSVPAFTSVDFLTGQRAIEARGLTPGTFLVTLRLLDRDGREFVHRNTRVRLSANSAITVLVTRDCTGVVCPAAGDTPSATECLGGVCVPPDCFIEDPASCPASACRAATDCHFAASCAMAACASGACVARADDSRCHPGEWCDPTRGCRPLDAILSDAGPRPDAGPVDMGPVPDVGPSPDTGPLPDTGAPRDSGARDAGGMDTGGCAPSVPCSTGGACETGHTNCRGACVHDTFLDSTTVCRRSAGGCDVAETCTGSSGDCPADALRMGGVCRGASGPCGAAERCNGSGVDCPPDEDAADGTNCGATWSELSCGPIDVDYCQSGACVHRSGYNGAGQPSCGALAGACGFAPGNCCGSGGFFCVNEPGNDIYGSSSDCGQCCRPGRCCMGGNPAGPCS